MSERLDSFVRELTGYIEEQMREEVEMALGVSRREDVAMPMFGSMCFICKDGGSASILARYLQNNMGVSLIHQEGSLYTLQSKSNERIHIWTLNNFNNMRGYRYQAIFIQDDIYEHELRDRASIYALCVNELIPPMEPWVFRLPKE